LIAFAGIVSCENSFVASILPSRTPVKAGGPQEPEVPKEPEIPVIPTPPQDETYTVVIDISGNESGDTVIVSPNTGNEGDTVTLEYTVADTAHYNLLDLSGVTIAIASVNGAGSGTRTYTIDTHDASSGVITITAVFTHTNLVPDQIEFTADTGHINKTYGDTAFTNAIAEGYLGSGTITYSSSDTTVATVDDSGQVTIHKTGSSVISAEKAADAVYAHAQAEYTLLAVNPKPVTITGLSASDKIYDGTTTATITGTAVINGKIDADTVTTDAGTATFADKNVGTEKDVTFSGWSLDGTDAGNYLLSAQPESVTANITVKTVTVSAGTPERTLIPFGGDTQYGTTKAFSVNGIVGSDTVTIGMAANSYGLSLSNNTNIGISGTITLTYNGTTTVAQTSAVSISLTISGNSNYALPVSHAVSAVIIDGQAEARAIPVTQTNISAFNNYAMTSNGLKRHYKLAQNISLAGTGNWTAIGTSYNNAFTGSFNGNGYSISNLNINSTSQYQGMFGCIGTGGVVYNVALVGGSVKGGSYTGGIAGYNYYGTIKNCYTTCSVSGGNYSGGIAGDNSGNILNCYTTGSVSGGNYTAGIAGKLYGNVQNCYATGSISGGGNTGGLVGVKDGNLTNCVVLNPSVQTTSTSALEVGRVFVPYDDGDTANNYARKSMILTYNNGAAKTPNANLYNYDGASITSVQYQSASWWTTAGTWSDFYGVWDFANVWQLNSTTNLPILRNVGGAQNHTVTGTDTGKATGALVTQPKVNSSVINSITVNAVSLHTATGQSAEYAISTSSNGSGLSAWQNGLTFTGLNVNTTYYVYARSAENTNYEAGPVNMSAGIKTVPVEMVSISAGTFTMGSPSTESGSDSDERPQHSVTLSSFKMGKYQVTQEQYQAVMGTNPSNFTSAVSGESGTPGKLPVERVSWYDTLVFCNKLSMIEGLSPAYRISGSTDPAAWGIVPTSSNTTWDAVQIVAGSTGYRLPTEAQWEYACRAGTTTAYNTGAAISDNTGWYTSNSGSKTHEVGKKPANAWGLYDMHGNVWEWCWDWYGLSYYSSSPASNPMGASSGAVRVLRGGSWSYSAESLRSACRGSSYPYGRFINLGFRLVRP